MGAGLNPKPSRLAFFPPCSTPGPPPPRTVRNVALHAGHLSSSTMARRARRDLVDRHHARTGRQRRARPAKIRAPCRTPLLPVPPPARCGTSRCTPAISRPARWPDGRVATSWIGATPELDDSGAPGPPKLAPRVPPPLHPSHFPVHFPPESASGFFEIPPALFGVQGRGGGAVPKVESFWKEAFRTQRKSAQVLPERQS